MRKKKIMALFLSAAMLMTSGGQNLIVSAADFTDQSVETEAGVAEFSAGEDVEGIFITEEEAPEVGLGEEKGVWFEEEHESTWYIFDDQESVDIHYQVAEEYSGNTIEYYFSWYDESGAPHVLKLDEVYSINEENKCITINWAGLWREAAGKMCELLICVRDADEKIVAEATQWITPKITSCEVTACTLEENEKMAVGADEAVSKQGDLSVSVVDKEHPEGGWLEAEIEKIEVAEGDEIVKVEYEDEYSCYHIYPLAVGTATVKLYYKAGSYEGIYTSVITVTDKYYEITRIRNDGEYNIVTGDTRMLIADVRVYTQDGNEEAGEEIDIEWETSSNYVTIERDENDHRILKVTAEDYPAELGDEEREVEIKVRAMKDGEEVASKTEKLLYLSDEYYSLTFEETIERNLEMGKPITVNPILTHYTTYESNKTKGVTVSGNIKYKFEYDNTKVEILDSAGNPVKGEWGEEDALEDMMSDSSSYSIKRIKNDWVYISIEAYEGINGEDGEEWHFRASADIQFDCLDYYDIWWDYSTIRGDGSTWIYDKEEAYTVKVRTNDDYPVNSETCKIDWVLETSNGDEETNPITSGYTVSEDGRAITLNGVVLATDENIKANNNSFQLKATVKSNGIVVYEMWQPLSVEVKTPNIRLSFGEEECLVGQKNTCPDNIATAWVEENGYQFGEYFNVQIKSISSAGDVFECAQDQEGNWYYKAKKGGTEELIFETTKGSIIKIEKTADEALYNVQPVYPDDGTRVFTDSVFTLEDILVLKGTLTESGETQWELLPLEQYELEASVNNPDLVTVIDAFNYQTGSEQGYCEVTLTAKITEGNVTKTVSKKFGLQVSPAFIDIKAESIHAVPGNIVNVGAFNPVCMKYDKENCEDGIVLPDVEFEIAEIHGNALNYIQIINNGKDISISKDIPLNAEIFVMLRCYVEELNMGVGSNYPIILNESSAEHSWEEIERTVETCTTAGSVTYTCKIEGCGEIKTENIPALGHDWDEGVVTEEPTTIKEGIRTYTCKRTDCGETKTETIAKLPGGCTEHDFKATASTPATCTTTGSVTYTCSHCGETKTETTPALGHSWSGYEYKAATCTESGLYIYDCTRCSASSSSSIPALGHSWDEGVVTKEPTITEEGIKTFTCKTCSATKTETIERLPDPSGVVIESNGNIILPGKDSTSQEDNTLIEKGEGLAPVYDPETGKVTVKEGNKVTLPSGIVLTPPEDSVVELDGTTTYPDKTVIDPDGTTHKTNGSVQAPDGTYLKPAQPMLEKAEVYTSGNQVQGILFDECEGAEGYDYVISKNINCTVDKDYYAVTKNVLDTKASFKYIPRGIYYVYCHAWVRDENGIKQFGEWSNYKKVRVTAITPEKPVITSVKARGNKVTVTYSKSKNATGYDVVLGSVYKKVDGEYRPVEYGKNVKKVGKDTYKVTFTNVPEGTYYAGLHSYNRTSKDGKKVFSPWSKTRRFTVK